MQKKEAVGVSIIESFLMGARDHSLPPIEGIEKEKYKSKEDEKFFYSYHIYKGNYTIIELFD